MADRQQDRQWMTGQRPTRQGALDGNRVGDALADAVGPASVRLYADGVSHVSDVSDVSDEYGLEAEWMAVPGDERQVAEVIRRSADLGFTIAARGGGTKDAAGAFAGPVGVVLSLEKLSGVLEHSAGDLMVSVLPGTTLRSLQEALKPYGQWLPLDPAWDDQCTIGGIVNANSSGPMRAGYGSVRDMLIASRVVYADGRIVRTGAKVVKHVAGYDMNKLFIGSMGTLGVHTELTFKVRPIPPERCVLLAGNAASEQLSALQEHVLMSHLEPVVFEWVSERPAQRIGLDTERPALAVGFVDMRSSVESQIREFTGLCGRCGVELLGRADGWEETEALLAEVRRLAPNARRIMPDEVAVALKLMGKLTDIRSMLEAAERRADEAGLPLSFSGGAATGIARAAVRLRGGESVAGAVRSWIRHVRSDMAARGVRTVIECAPRSVRAGEPVWGDISADMRIMHKIKQQIDPDGRLCPGKFGGDGSRV